MGVSVKIYSADKTCKRIIGSPIVKRYVAETWATIFRKYTPKDSGLLSQTYTIDDSKITYEQNYSHYQWYGISKNGKPLNYNREKNVNATSHWEEYAYKAKKEEVANSITEFIKRM